MKILIVDNAAMVLNKNRYYTNNLNGLFISDLIDCGHELTYFQFTNENSNNISVFDLEKNGVKCISLTSNKNKIIRYVIAYLKIIPTIIKNDFVYFYYPNTFKFATIFCLLLNRKYGLYIRGMNGLDDVFSKIIYKNAFTIFTVSDHFTQFVNNIKSNVAHTIRPMIPYTDVDIINNRIYNKSVTNILFLGRISKDKGLSELLDAINILKYKYNRDIFLKLVGNGEYIDELKQRSIDLNIKDLVSFEGPVYDDDIKKKYYFETDIYILPTYHEGFPRTLYEAMIFGTPIITTFVGGIPALMKDGFNCKEIKPKSIESIVEGLEFAFNNYSQMVEYAQNATKTVEKVVDSKRPTHAHHLHQIISKLC